MKPLSRRSVTTGIAAAVAAIPAVGLCKGAKESSELRELIKAHRAAHRAFCRAIDRLDVMTEAYKKSEATVPCFMVGEAYEIKLGRAFCEKNLAAAYTRERDRLKALGRIAPDLAEQARAAIDAKEAENRVLLDSMLAEEEARKEAFGLSQAERDWESTEQAEHEAGFSGMRLSLPHNRGS